MKSPGPFYQLPDGSFFRDDMELDAEPYRRALEAMTVWEVRGRIDFEAAVNHCRSLTRVRACSENC